MNRYHCSYLQSAGLGSGRHSPKFSIVSLQKTYVSAIFQGSFDVVAQKAFIQIRRYLARTYPLINCEVFGMPAFFAPIDQPDIHAFAVGIYSEFTGIHKLLLFPAASAAKIHFYIRILRCFQRLPFRQVSDP